MRAAAAANNGAAPPDLSLMAWAREGGDDYIFHLLTGFLNHLIHPFFHSYSYGFDTPEGIQVDEGKAYNPYFPNGGVLAMPQQLFDEGIEYQDGTPATMSQQAKDVTTVSAFAFEEIQITILFVFSFCAGPLNNGMIQGKNMRLWYGKKFRKKLICIFSWSC